MITSYITSGKPLLRRSTLLVFLLASVAVARDRAPRVRNVYLRDNPKNEAERVYVTGEVVTVLRFQRPCDPARTKMLGWEGRFEPVECAGKRVLVEPLQNLEPEDRFLLLVTLEDGKELPFTVTAIGTEEWERPDQQVNVFLDPESPVALRKQLDDPLARERILEEAYRRHGRENTADHALARLVKEVLDSAWVELDVNQTDDSPITLYDGPVESMLNDDLGPLAPPTRLYGKVWTGGPQVVIRYYEAKPLHGDVIPICAVARLAMGQLKKLPGSKPGMAIVESSSAGVYIVDAFR